MHRMALAGVSLLLVASIGCGGDDANQPVTKASYIAAAETICAKRQAEVQALRQPGLDPAAISAFVTKADELATAQLTELKALEKPPGEAAAIDALFGQIDAVVADLKALKAASAANDLNALINLAVTVRAKAATAAVAARAYGFSLCATTPGADSSSTTPSPTAS